MVLAGSRGGERAAVLLLRGSSPALAAAAAARGRWQRRVERSTDQVIKPVNVEALSKWVGKIPADVLQDMPVIAPMLAKLGYDPYANPPNYGKPDQKVVENTRRVYKGEFQLPDFLKEVPQPKKTVERKSRGKIK